MWHILMGCIRIWNYSNNYRATEFCCIVQASQGILQVLHEQPL